MAVGVGDPGEGSAPERGGDRFDLYGERAILATMHGKERVIAPLLGRFLGLRVETIPGFDTDRFGTFSREVERTGSQLDAARAKIAAAFDGNPDARIGLASEGSFGPHPYLPFVPLGREVVVLTDRETDFELIGHHADPGVNFAHAVVSDVPGATAFAECVGFPEHGLIVTGCADGKLLPSLALIKTVGGRAELERAVEQVLERCGAAFVETDMRAHRNPRRMRAIKRATLDLIRRFRNRCPACARPGFVVTERVSGLPCSWCRGPTQVIRAESSSCVGCGHRDERPTGQTMADPGQCDRCNP